MAVNIEKLEIELRAAGIPIIGVRGTGNCTAAPPFICDGAEIEYDPSATPGQITQGQAILAAHDSTTPMGHVSCLATGPKLIGVVGDPAQRWFPERYRIIVVQASGVTTSPTVSLGTNEPLYNNIAAATALGSIGLSSTADMRNVAVTLTRVISNRVAVYANVTIAAVATQFVIRADFIGDYEPK